MKNINILILLAIIGGGIALNFILDGKEIKQTAYIKLPNIEFNLLDTRKIFLNDFNDKPIIIHFWATWCAPCLVEFPDLMKMALKYEEDVDVIAIAVQDDELRIKEFLKKNNITLPQNVYIAQDPNWKIAKSKFNTTKLPESYLVSHKQEIIDRYNGAVENWIKMPWTKDFNALQTNNIVDNK